MDFTVFSALDLSDVPTPSIISITEDNLCNASFLFASIIEHRLKQKELLVLILHNYSFGHYCGMCTKLGVNLQKEQENENVLVIDVMDKIGTMWMENKAEGDKLIDILGNTFKEVLNHLKSQSRPATIFIERPDNVGIAHGEWPRILRYISILSSLKSSGSNSLVFLTKRLPSERPLQVLNASLQHISDLTVNVLGLRTGIAQDISGSILVKRKDMDKEHDLKCLTEFHYQLLDRSIRLFAPGTVQFR